MDLQDVTTAAEWAAAVDRRFTFHHRDMFCQDPGHERSGLRERSGPYGGMVELVAWIEDHWDCHDSIDDHRDCHDSTDDSTDEIAAADSDSTGERASRLRTVPDVAPLLASSLATAAVAELGTQEYFRPDVLWTQPLGCPECGHGRRQAGCACCTLNDGGAHQ